MITIRPGVKADFKYFIGMNKTFRSEYDGTLIKSDLSAKQAYMQSLESHYFIFKHHACVGYFTLHRMSNGQDQFNCFWDMFIVKEHRHMGYAKMARQLAIKKYNARGLFVAYGRIKKHINYWREIGFTHINWDIHEQGANDKCCANLTIGALCNVSVPLTIDGVEQTQQTARNYWGM